MPKQNTSASLPAVTTVVDALREEILARNEEGWLLGYEEELRERMGVSRPTLRQALRVLESQGLVEVRRGVNGGLYGCVPHADAVARNASVYLRSHGTSASELMVAQSAIFASMMWMTVHRPDRDSLQSWMREQDAMGEYTARRALETSFEFMRRTAALADNRALRLFQDVLYNLAQGPYNVGIFSEPDRVEHTLTYLRRLAAMMAAGDSRGAVAEIDKNTRTILEWISESEAKR